MNFDGFVWSLPSTANEAHCPCYCAKEISITFSFIHYVDYLFITLIIFFA